MTKLTITKQPIEDRPREKLMEKGAANLSDAELLAILIGSGSTRETAVELMKRILVDCRNNLNTLGKMELHELMSYNGIGEAKAVTIMAACELGRRRQLLKAEERQQIDSAADIYDLMHPKMQDNSTEEAWILLLNQNRKLIKTTRISTGGLSETVVDVRIIMREALLHKATIIALCHNHPSQNATPSTADNRLTQRVKQACDMLNIHFLDHLIITDGQYYSYQESGKL